MDRCRGGRLVRSSVDERLVSMAWCVLSPAKQRCTHSLEIIANGVRSPKRTKETSPFDAWAPNVSLYDVSNSTPTSVSVRPEDVVFL